MLSPMKAAGIKTKLADRENRCHVEREESRNVAGLLGQPWRSDGSSWLFLSMSSCVLRLFSITSGVLMLRVAKSGQGIGFRLVRSSALSSLWGLAQDTPQLLYIKKHLVYFLSKTRPGK